MTGTVGVLYLFASGALSVVDRGAASVAGRVIHHTIRPTHWVVQLSDTATASITADCQVLL